MICLTIDTKTCMSHLLLKNSFDSFSFIEGDITTFAKFSMNGCLQRDFFDEPPAREYALWKDFREYCLGIIKGKRTPVGFKFVFALAPENLPDFILEHGLHIQPEDVQGLYLNFRYDGARLSCITGTSLHLFTLDKSVDHVWDEWVRRMFARLEIPHENSGV